MMVSIRSLYTPYKVPVIFNLVVRDSRDEIPAAWDGDAQPAC